MNASGWRGRIITISSRGRRLSSIRRHNASNTARALKYWFSM